MKKVFLLFVTALLLFISVTSCINYENINVDEFASLVTSSDVVLLDVRTADEFDEGHILNAINIDVKQDGFVQEAKCAIPESKTVAVYCRSGGRSSAAAKKLVAEGYRVVNLEGGIVAWKEAGMPIETVFNLKDEGAFESYRVSAEKGNPESMVKLGRCYLLGIGVEIDEEKTEALF